MSHHRTNRRQFLQQGALVTGAALAPELLLGHRSFAQEARTPNARPRIGCIGVGGRGTAIARQARAFGDVVAVCDVDRTHAERGNMTLSDGKAALYEDYEKLLDRKDVDVVTIGTPDHWHTKIALDALRSGRDVYCEKPLTLTIDEGRQLARAVRETKRVFQVGTQQRSEFRNMFLTAVAMAREGRIGKVKRVTCVIGSALAGGPFMKTSPPAALNWDLWLGPAPREEFIPERCHSTFRWWYEYSGGKMTDWGAHHVDIAQWAIGMEKSGPTHVEPVSVSHPVPMEHGWPTADDRYNTATDFLVRCRYPNEVEVLIRSDGENGITFEGEKGTFFVSRSQLTGEPVEALKTDPIPEATFVALRKGKRLDTHMANFFECVRDRSEPVSDVYSHHRSLTTCHLANIALRLNRRLTWDAENEQILGDPEANAFQRRESRKGYEL